MLLNSYDNNSYKRGANFLKEILWILISIIFSSSIPGSLWRVIILRLFGSKIGTSVVIKPLVKIKFPWKLTIGNCSWIGENVWIDNLGNVTIGNNVCLSQAVYLCTGSHDWEKSDFRLIINPIFIEDKAWICAFSRIGPGVTIGEGAVLGFGSTTTQNLANWSIYKSSKCIFIKKREIKIY